MRVIREVRSGSVLEKEIFTVPDGSHLTKRTEPKEEPVKTAEERAEINRRKSERIFIRKINSSFTSQSWYVTLTYRDFDLPLSYGEAERCLENFLRRLKRWAPGVRYIAVTGYGKQSSRLHHHLIIDGNGIDGEKLLELWTAGDVKRAERLRHNNYYDGKNCGEDFTGLAVYLHAHSNAKAKGKRWKESRNVAKPFKDTPRPLKRELSEEKPPKAPKGYRFVGVYVSDFHAQYISFKYVKIQNEQAEIRPFSNDLKVHPFSDHEGREG